MSRRTVANATEGCRPSQPAAPRGSRPPAVAPPSRPAATSPTAEPRLLLPLDRAADGLRLAGLRLLPREHRVDRPPQPLRAQTRIVVIAVGRAAVADRRARVEHEHVRRHLRA